MQVLKHYCRSNTIYHKMLNFPYKKTRPPTIHFDSNKQKWYFKIVYLNRNREKLSVKGFTSYSDALTSANRCREHLELHGKGSSSEKRWYRILTKPAVDVDVMAETEEGNYAQPKFTNNIKWELEEKVYVIDDSESSWGQLHTTNGKYVNLTMRPHNQSTDFHDPRIVSAHSIGSSTTCSVQIADKRLQAIHFIIYIRHRHPDYSSLCMLKNCSNNNIMLRCCQPNHFDAFVIPPGGYGPIDSHTLLILLDDSTSTIDVISNYRFIFLTSPLEQFASAMHLHSLLVSTVVADVNMRDTNEVAEYRQSITNQWSETIWCGIVYEDVIRYCSQYELLKPDGLEVVIGSCSDEACDPNKIFLQPSGLTPLGRSNFVLKSMKSHDDSQYSVTLINKTMFDMAVCFLSTEFTNDEGSRTIKLSPGMQTDLDHHTILCLRGGYTNNNSIIHVLINSHLPCLKPVTIQSYQKQVTDSEISKLFWGRIYNDDTLLYLCHSKTPIMDTDLDQYTGSYCLFGRCVHCCIQLNDLRLTGGVHCAVHLVARQDDSYYAFIHNCSETTISIIYHDTNNETSEHKIFPGRIGVLLARSVLQLVDDASTSHLNFNLEICADFTAFKPLLVAQNNCEMCELNLNVEALSQPSIAYNVFAFRLRSYLQKYYRGSCIPDFVVEQADSISDYYCNTGREIQAAKFGGFQENNITSQCCV